MEGIRVNVSELLDILNEMVEEGYSTVELNTVLEPIEEDSYINLYAVDPINEQVIEYGTIAYDNGEL